MSTADWLAYRTRTGIGASEVGIILGLSQYKSALQMFYDKIGERLVDDAAYSMPAFMGHVMEPVISDLWEYWEGSEETIIRNKREGKRVGLAVPVNAIAHNRKYPHLFVSLDREGHRISTYNGQPFPLELKTIAAWESDKWSGGIPPLYVVQIQTQMLVCEETYAEMAILKNGNCLDVLSFEANPGIQQTIVERTKLFWDKVVEGRKLITQMVEAERNGNYKLRNELDAAIVDLEPPVDGSDSFSEYLAKKHPIAESGILKGTDELLTHAERHKYLQGQIKKLEEEKQLHENYLKSALRNHEKLDFLNRGYVAWKTSEKGVRVFNNRIKSV
ncbi:MAG TPA: YqaJ viral recombinase family protein [Flavisolibacter sp.]|nr:YqaJ viral recombinase family protein [Flavisolibacter sp.]